MIKKILPAFITVVLLAGIGVIIWYCVFKEKPLNGDISNSHTVKLCLHDNVYYDVEVPNELTLLETDESTVYVFEHLTVGVQPTEPDKSVKSLVDGVWVFADSDELWYNTVKYSFENSKPYSIEPRYKELYDSEGNLIHWNTGTPMSITYPPEEPLVAEGTHIYEDSYVTNQKYYGHYEDAVQLSLAKLCLYGDCYVPEYYDDGEYMYAEYGDYCVGVRKITYTTQTCVIAKGAKGLEEAKKLINGRCIY